MDNFTTNATWRLDQKYHVGGTTLQYSHFFNSMPSGALPSTFFTPTSFQFVDSTVPFDSTCSVFAHKMLLILSIYILPIADTHFHKLISLVLTNDFIMALLVSSSASLYMSLKNLFRAASPSSFSSFS